MSDRFQHLRLIEALLFAASNPLSRNELMRHLPEDADLDGLLEELKGLYANRGVNLVPVGERWAIRTAPDLGPMMKLETTVRRRLSRAAVETLAVVAYHQPVTRAEIEEIRGVGLSRGTLDVLLEAGWIKPRGRRKVPGRPVTWGVTPAFLDHFGLEDLDSLPGREELKAAGLLDTRPAISVLAARGELEEESEEGEEDGEEALEAEEALAADFGDDLVAKDDKPDAETAAEGGGSAEEGEAEAGVESEVASEASEASANGEQPQAEAEEADEAPIDDPDTQRESGALGQAG